MLEKIAQDFLLKNYSLKKIKYGKFFKKAMVFDTNTRVFIENESSLLLIKSKLNLVLKLVFDFDYTTSEGIINDFLYSQAKIIPKT
jgi:hypothetical protein